jgi:hypothetical protein
MVYPLIRELNDTRRGQGIARQRQAIITGLRDSVKEFDVAGINSKDGTSWARQGAELTV